MSKALKTNYKECLCYFENILNENYTIFQSDFLILKLEIAGNFCENMFMK